MKRLIGLVISLFAILSVFGCSNTTKTEQVETNYAQQNAETKEEHVHAFVDTRECIRGTYIAYNDTFSCDKVFKCECGETKNVSSRISEKDYKDYLLSLKWNWFDFDDAERFPTKHKDGNPVAVVGTVSWVNFYSEKGENFTEIGLYLMDDSTLSYTDNYVVVGYPMGYNTEIGRILEGDEIVILGRESGAYTYTSISDKQITAPSIYAAYIILGAENIKLVNWE